MREIMDKLRKKYKQVESELKDINSLHQAEKDDLLDVVRQQTKNVKFCDKVMSILLTENELYKLNQKSTWSDEKQDWQIPYFSFNPKSQDLAFPTINAKQRVEQIKDEREIAFDVEPIASAARRNEDLDMGHTMNKFTYEG